MPTVCGEDVFLMPEVMREAMTSLEEMRNGKAELSGCKSVDFSITDYSVEHIED